MARLDTRSTFQQISSQRYAGPTLPRARADRLPLQPHTCEFVSLGPHNHPQADLFRHSDALNAAKRPAASSRCSSPSPSPTSPSPRARRRTRRSSPPPGPLDRTAANAGLRRRGRTPRRGTRTLRSSSGASTSSGSSATRQGWTWSRRSGICIVTTRLKWSQTERGQRWQGTRRRVTGRELGSSSGGGTGGATTARQQLTLG